MSNRRSVTAVTGVRVEYSQEITIGIFPLR
jgi:hypothetical protein